MHSGDSQKYGEYSLDPEFLVQGIEQGNYLDLLLYSIHIRCRSSSRSHFELDPSVCIHRLAHSGQQGDSACDSTCDDLRRTINHTCAATFDWCIPPFLSRSPAKTLLA